MAEVTQVNGRPVIDYMARDAASFLQSMRALIPGKLPEWTDYESEADFGNVLLELFAHMGDILSYYQDRVANESFLGTAQERRSVIQHLRLIGYTLSTAAPAAGTLTLSVPATATEVLTIRRGDAFATRGQRDKPSVRFEYSREQPLTINCATLPVDPATNRKVHAGIPVEEGRLIREEVVATSPGTANQRYRLPHPNMILRSLGQGQSVNRDIILSTELGPVRDEWTLRESLAFSREGQKDFAIDVDAEDRGTVMFGDGVLGAIPAAGAVIKVSYRVGGGAHGNTAPNTIQTVIDAPQLALLGAQVTNPAAATGGAERESIAHAVSHAPQVFRSLKRAVTARDYEALALDFKGVGKVLAEGTSWNVVTLFVAPAGGGHVSDVLTANLLAYFEDKRPISTIIEIEDVDYVPIYVTAHVGVKSYFNGDEVTEYVQQAVRALLAFENVGFQQTVYLSKFYEAIEAIDGVAFVNISEFRRDGQPAGGVEPAGKIELSAHEIPTIPSDSPAYAAGLRLELEEGS
ncbi:MAG: baseplate J/gp47 family protein [Acidobacteriota bacterium]